MSVCVFVCLSVRLSVTLLPPTISPQILIGSSPNFQHMNPQTNCNPYQPPKPYPSLPYYPTLPYYPALPLLPYTLSLHLYYITFFLFYFLLTMPDATFLPIT